MEDWQQAWNTLSIVQFLHSLCYILSLFSRRCFGEERHKKIVRTLRATRYTMATIGSILIASPPYIYAFLKGTYSFFYTIIGLFSTAYMYIYVPEKRAELRAKKTLTCFFIFIISTILGFSFSPELSEFEKSVANQTVSLISKSC